MARSPDAPITQWQDRERAFLIGAPLAIVPALIFHIRRGIQAMNWTRHPSA